MKKIRLSSYKKNEVISYGIVIVFFGIFSLLKGVGLLSNSLSGQLIPITCYMIMAISLNLVVGISGELSLGHAGFMAVGAYTGIIISTSLQGVVNSSPIRLALAVICGMIASGIVGFLIGIPVLRLKGDYLAIVTLAFGEIIRNFLNIIYIGTKDGKLFFTTDSNVTLSSDVKLILSGPMGATSTQKISTFLAGIIILLIALYISQNLINSKTGRAIMSIRDNKIASESIGLSIMKYKMTAFVTSAMLAGMAGVLFGLNYSSLAPSKFGFNQSILILVFVVLGGIGNIWGGMISAMVLTILPEALRGFSDYRMLVYAIVLILVMIFTYNPKIKSYIVKYKENLPKLFKKKEGKTND